MYLIWFTKLIIVFSMY